MNVYETRNYEMLVRVREFGDSHGDLFPKSTLAGQTFAEVAEAVEELGQHAVSKMSAAREGSRTRTAAREALYDRLVAMHQTARVIARDTAGLEGKFQLPEGKGDQALITAGRFAVRDAEDFAAQFVARAMPKTFIKDLIGLVDKLEAAINTRAQEREEMTSARLRIRAAVKKGVAAAEVLDAMVVNHLHDDPVGLAVWEGARRIDHRRLGTRRRGGARINAPTSPVAVTPPAPVAPAPVAVAPAPSAPESAPAAPAPSTNNGASADQKVA